MEGNKMDPEDRCRRGDGEREVLGSLETRCGMVMIRQTMGEVDVFCSLSFSCF